MLLFAISADLGYPIFTNSHEKLISVFVRIFTQSDASGPHFYKFSYRLENCHVTVSLILCCLRSKSFRLRGLWRHKLQWRHIRNRFIRVRKRCMFHWRIDCGKYYCLIAYAKTGNFLDDPRTCVSDATTHCVILPVDLACTADESVSNDGDHDQHSQSLLPRQCQESTTHPHDDVSNIDSQSFDSGIQSFVVPSLEGAHCSTCSLQDAFRLFLKKKQVSKLKVEAI